MPNLEYLPVSAKPKKTIEVAVLLDWINGKLANPNLTQDCKAVYCGVIESVLSSTNQYNGYMYLPSYFESGMTWRYERQYNMKG